MSSDNSNNNSANNKNLQHLVIVPTEKCNFRCTYCYENFEVGKMSSDVISAIKNYITNRVPQIGHLAISWFGGEPLVASDIVVELTNFAKSTCAQNNAGFSCSMTTNGYLLNADLFESLTALGVRRYQISLDGEREEHDRTRKNLNGAGTYDRIMDNLLHMKSSVHEFEVVLRVHFTSDGKKSPENIINVLSGNFGNDSRFRVNLKTIEDYSVASMRKLDHTDRCEERRYTKHVNSLMPESMPIEFDDQICYASRPDSLIIRPNGTLAKCTIAFQDETHCIGKINQDGTIDVNGDKFSAWIRGIETLESGALKCPLQGISY